MRGQSRTRSIVLCGLSIALLAVGAFVTVPVPLGLTPFTLQTMMLFIILMVLSPTEAFIAVAGYLLLGALGLPIFSGMTGGFAKLIGPTGGFLVGYLVAALAVGGMRVLFMRNGGCGAKKERLQKVWRIAFDVLMILLACVLFFTLGTIWYSVNMGVDLAAALVACVLPFVVTEPIKIAVAVVCIQPVRHALGLNTSLEKD